MLEGFVNGPIRRIAIALSHTCLVLDLPRKTRDALFQFGIEVLFEGRIDMFRIEIDDVDIVERCRFFKAVQVIPNPISNEAGRDPAVFEVQ